MRFCISRDKLILLLENEIKKFTFEEILRFSKAGFALGEMIKQQISDSGPFNEALAEAIKKFTNKTENVEINIALSLSAIYDLGPKNEIAICFEMKNGFNGKISTFSDLTANIESATHVDCSLICRKTEWCFQIKRYPSAYLEFSENGISAYLKKLFNEKYGEMSDINLIILLQPEQEAATTPINFGNIYQLVKSMPRKISYGEVSFIFNANMKDMMLIRVFPEFIKTKMPLELKSPKYQELQNRWAEEIRKQKSQKIS